MPKLKPRLNYCYSFYDAMIALKGIVRNDPDYSDMFSMFRNSNLFFVNHARTGIRIALSSLELPPGSKVGVQAFNCHTVFNAIVQAGYVPVFIDINDNFKIDVEDLKRKKNHIQSLIITHLFGIPADLDKIKEILPDLPIIEDCSHSFLSSYNDIFTGNFGDISVFSMGKAKFPSIGQGGFIVINNLKYLDYIKNELSLLKKNSFFNEIKNIVLGVILNFLHHSFIYGNITKPILKKLDDSKDFSGKFKSDERSILKGNKNLFLRRFRQYFDLKAEQKKNASELAIQLAGSIPNHIISDNSKSDLNNFMLPILIENDREEMIRDYNKKGIEIGSHFSQSINWAHSFGYNSGDCINSEKISLKIVAFPTYYSICNFKKNK